MFLFMFLYVKLDHSEVILVFSLLIGNVRRKSSALFVSRGLNPQIATNFKNLFFPRETLLKETLLESINFWRNYSSKVLPFFG